MMPCTDQAKYLGSSAGAGCESGKLEISNLLNDSQHLWRQYFDHMTSVKEANTDNPQIVRFEATLDLAPFCSFARPVADLVSK
jgi:hypothetical protein